MFCIRCGKQIADGSKFCPGCGAAQKAAQTEKNLSGAGAPSHSDGAAFRAEERRVAGYSLTPTGGGNGVPIERASEKSKILAGLFGIFLGWAGVHNFYLGKIARGLAQVAVSLLTCGVFGAVWGIAEGVLCLCGKYEDGKGFPLVG